MNCKHRHPKRLPGSAWSSTLICVCLALTFNAAQKFVVAEETELLSDAAFRAALDQPIDAVSWRGKTLRGVLERVTQSQRVAVMLDRRIDPDQVIDFNAASIPLERMIDQLARQYGGTSCRVGPVVYVGPENTCTLLATVAELRREEIRKLPAAKQRQLLKAAPWSWQRLASPRELLEDLEREYGVRIDGKDNMPHDLWPAMQLPPCDFASKLSLVLAGFHVTFAWSDDGNVVRIVAMPMSASLSRKYDSGARTETLARILKAKFEDASITVSGNRLVVDGRIEVHEAVEGLLSGETARRPADTGRKHYTLNVENKAAGGVVRALGAQIGKEVVLDVKVKRRLTTEVTLSVKEVSLEELLSAVLSPAALKYEIDGDTIRVYD